MSDVRWSPSGYMLTVPPDASAETLAEAVSLRACRTDFSRPGFCLLDLGLDVASIRLRAFMFDLKCGLQRLHRQQTGRNIVYLSAGRFDQQVTTKPHRDGAPDESCLMLGYEPSRVESEISLLDYSRCAFDMQMTPEEFLARHNPMFGDGEQLLQPYSTRIPKFDHEHSYILLINNSMTTFDPAHPLWQGVLHTAVIPHPSEDLSRVINSTMLAAVDAGMMEPLSPSDLKEFLTTSLVRRSGYQPEPAVK